MLLNISILGEVVYIKVFYMYIVIIISEVIIIKYFICTYIIQAAVA